MIQYPNKDIKGEIDLSIVLELNDLAKPQIDQKTNYFIFCSELGPRLQRYVTKTFMKCFMELISKTQLNCIINVLIYFCSAHVESD